MMPSVLVAEQPGNRREARKTLTAAATLPAGGARRRLPHDGAMPLLATAPERPATALALAFSRARAFAPHASAAPAPSAANDALASNGATLDEVLDEALLLQAWERVRANGGAAGLDGESVAAFARQALGHLQALQSEVRSGRYLVRPLHQLLVPKGSGGTRALAVPAVRDRVLLGALALVLGERLEPLFDDASHAYRPGRSVLTAIAQVLQRRDEGMLHVLEADIEAFFDRIHHPSLLAALQPHVACPALMRLIRHVLTPLVSAGGSEHLTTRGLPQGSPLSPLLANLVLHPLDAGLRAAGHALVRYADDCAPRRRTGGVILLGSHAAQEMRAGPSKPAYRRRW